MPYRQETLAEAICRHGWSRRAFMAFCSASASLLALPPAAASAMATSLEKARRQSVVWLSFQECTGCTESLLRSEAPDFERLILRLLSLDYHHTLQAASGDAAELAREQALAQSQGASLLVVDGSVPIASGGGCCTISGVSSLELLRRCVEEASMVVAVGTCASFGGLAAAAPNPTQAASVAELMENGKIAPRPLVNLPGCPPVPAALGALFVHLITFGNPPELDNLQRPRALFGNTVHERCSRLNFFHEGKFARSFDDEGARQGWCLYELGCKGPLTHNACSSLRWNGGTSNPIEAGHPCIGCSEPQFWDKGSFYQPLKAVPPEESGQALYEDNCLYCHGQDPGAFHTPPDEVPTMLEPGRIRAHRFQLDNTQMESLVKYLKEPWP